MNTAHNKMALDEQISRLTHFVVGNQQYEFNRLFYARFIEPAAFSALMSIIFISKILSKNFFIFIDDDSIQLQTKQEML